MPNSQTTLRNLVDLALGGELDDLLKSWADARVSAHAATRLLAQRIGGIELDHRTVMKWLRPYRDTAA